LIRNNKRGRRLGGGSSGNNTRSGGIAVALRVIEILKNAHFLLRHLKKTMAMEAGRDVRGEREREGGREGERERKGERMFV
jgi:hypothetical protein